MLMLPTAARRALASCSPPACLCLLLLVMASPVGTQAAPGWLSSEAGSSQFGDWFVLCDDSLNCQAYTDELDNVGAGLFTLARHPDDHGWSLSISLSGTRPDLSNGIQVVVDDMPEYLPDGSVSLRSGEVIPGTATSYQILPKGAGAERVLERLWSEPAMDVKFPRVSVDFTDCTGAENTQSFSRSGVTAALAWIAEKQGRPVGRGRLSTTVVGLGTAISPNCSH